MCGIFGFRSSINLENIFFDAMAHRGPDYKNCKKFQNWTLGHLRLSIIDTSSSANQPFEKHGAAIVFNGEIYNYLEFDKSYKSDVYCLIPLYNKYGINFSDF